MSVSTWNAAAVLRVADVRASVAFYRSRLGFVCPDEQIMAEPGGSAIYAIVRRNGVAIHLGRIRSGQPINPGTRPNAQGVYLYVDDIDALYAELQGRGAQLSGPPQLQGYGMREVWLTDPDGYQITFGLDADHPDDA